MPEESNISFGRFVRSYGGTLVLLITCLVFPSLSVVLRYGHAKGVVLYTAVSLLIIPPAVWWYLRMSRLVSTRMVWIFSALCLLVLAALFVVVYPIAQSGKLGPGSDGDDALNLGISELLHGRYPYYPKTYLGNPISPMPGALFFGIPFYLLLGNAAYQNIFWLYALFALVVMRTREVRLGLLLLLLLGSMPGFMHAYVIGNDYATNAILVLFFAQLLLLAVSRSCVSTWIWMILLGVSLSFRADFVFVLPLVLSALWQRVGPRRAVQYMMVTCVVTMGVTLPFIVYDPDHFSPFHTAGKLAAANAMVPHADVAIIGLCLAAALLLALRGNNRNDATLFGNCAWVQLIPVLCLLALAGNLGFGLFFAIFGAYAAILQFGDPAQLKV